MATQDLRGIDIFLNPQSRDISFGSDDDFILACDNTNVEQAIRNRLSTKLAELSLNAEYGSNLVDILGEKNLNLTLGITQQFVKEALLQEPRIDEIQEIAPVFDGIDTIQISIIVSIIGSNDPLNLVYPLFLNT